RAAGVGRRRRPRGRACHPRRERSRDGRAARAHGRGGARMTDAVDHAPFYHDGMRELQDRFDGRRVADALEKHRLHFEFWEQDRKLIGEARFFFIATSYRDNVDCSMRSGDPGFVRITGPDTLEYPEYDGNNMYRTLGNIHRNP